MSENSPLANICTDVKYFLFTYLRVPGLKRYIRYMTDKKLHSSRQSLVAQAQRLKGGFATDVTNHRKLWTVASKHDAFVGDRGI